MTPRTDMALVSRDQPTYNLIRLKPGWVQVYEDSLSAVFARSESPQAEAMRKAASLRRATRRRRAVLPMNSNKIGVRVA